MDSIVPLEFKESNDNVPGEIHTMVAVAAGARSSQTSSSHQKA